ncbi:MAG TPA: peptidoglycan bridge formation glycyltransferase FemA/FemB family protein [bacterium]|nr:peptidoglycan bridge formation glycyltransferase FemA/FemB family protein [bacterium]
MKFAIITDQNYQKSWNEFVIKNSSPADFLQSWQWGEFHQKKLREKILRLAVYDSTLMNADGADEGELIAVAQFIYQKLPLGKKYLFCPRGPILKCQSVRASSVKSQNEGIINILFEEIKKMANDEKVVFMRMEPPDNCHLDDPPTSGRDPEKEDWIPNPALLADKQVLNDKTRKPKILTHSVNPKNTLLLDLTKSEEEILAGMHPKWRYNIRLAEKREVSIKCQMSNFQCQNQTYKNEIDEFYKLLQETAKRDGIKIFNKKYYESLIEYFYCHSDRRSTSETLSTEVEPAGRRGGESKKRSPDPEYSELTMTKGIEISLLLAIYQDKPLSAIMLLGFGDTLTYLHGGSSNENRAVMPNHAIQWAAIKWAKKNGYKWYDFWGVNKTKEQKEKDKENKKNNWQGITRFKLGFVNEKTSQEINYLGARDLVVNKLWYNLYRLGKWIKF